MTSLPITNKAMRDAVVAEVRELKATSAKLTGSDAQKLRLKSRELLASYRERLPVWTLAVCPICDAPYRHRIDPFGFDGPWWDDNLNPNVNNCEHARVIRSAHHGYGMMEPRYQKEHIQIGPYIPYVIPYLRDLVPMTAVASRHQYPCGDPLYAMVYFSEKAPMPFRLCVS